MKVIFIDSNPVIVKCWQLHYRKIQKLISQYQLPLIQPTTFEFHATTIENYVEHQTLPRGKTSIVTPTNSLSYMGSGFDQYLLKSLLLGTSTVNYKHLENIIQNHQLTRYRGYLIPNHIYKYNLLQLPQTSEYNYKETLAYTHLHITEIIQIPTMVIPEKIDHSHILEAVWSLLTHLTQEDPVQPDNLIIPGLGTGYGKLSEYDSTKIMIFAMVLYNLQFPNSRLGQLKKSLLILFFFNKQYRMFHNFDDVQELEDHVVSEYGQSIELHPGQLMELDQLFKCVQL
ncbi:uncharacterized protein LODBEIA_P27250 [Lodderomyces beijingensis]|uniref:Macro-like domain-containing protein n=1 Tax=Lodderomyces beijingensis TaxID=1775926 RepID=A0ABP0ZK36_9ASCO